MGVVVGLLWFIFIVSALLLVMIILIQEGKGGGLAEAFGGQGAETFGVKATGVNRVTGILAGVFLCSSIFINKCSYQQEAILDDAPASTTDGAPSMGAPPADSGDGGGDEGN